jgi:hypothetical protein
MNSLLTLLIVAVGATAPNERRYPDAVQVYHCGFEQQNVAADESWPSGWTRRRGRGYPHYLPVEMTARPSPEGKRCLRLQLDGGAVVVSSPPVPATVDSRYVLEAFIKTEQLKHDRATISITFLDENQKPLDTFSSVATQHTSQWSKLHLGPIASTHEAARFVTIGLHLEPTAKPDLVGAAMFDDIWLGRLPRIKLEVSDPLHLYRVGQEVAIRCQVSGFDRPPADLELEVEDGLGQPDRETGRRFNRLPSQPAALASLAGTKLETVRSKSYSWAANIDRPGFYRVSVKMPGASGFIHEDHVSLAVIEPTSTVATGEFGWSLQSEHHLKRVLLVRLLSQSGVQWVKYPLWIPPGDKARLDETAAIIDDLRSRQIGVIGVLDQMPTDSKRESTDDGQSAADDLFESPTATWYPTLEPVLARFSLQVRFWQLGSDRDLSFVGYPELAKKVTEVKQQLDQVAQDANLGLPWSWQDEPPAAVQAPWRFLSMSARPALTASELSEYFQSQSASGVQRWISLQPLDRDHYSAEDRVCDLVQRMITAKVHGVRGIFLTDPLGAAEGLMNADGSPGELFLPWRTVATSLAGAQYAGKIDMPSGSQNHIFFRENMPVIVVSSNRPRREQIYLGDDTQQTDVWGRVTKPAYDGRNQVLETGPIPTFITGANPALVRWLLAMRLAKPELRSLLGVPQSNAILVRNTFDRPITATLVLVPPEGWRAIPDRFELNLGAGEEAQLPLKLAVPLSGNTGVQTVRFDLDVVADRRYQFSGQQRIEVGEKELQLDVRTRVNRDGDLEVEQRIVNAMEKPMSFRCELFAPGKRRMRWLASNVTAGEDLHTYLIPEGKNLMGQKLWIRAEEIGGRHVLSYRFIVGED